MLLRISLGVPSATQSLDCARRDTILLSLQPSLAAGRQGEGPRRSGGATGGGTGAATASCRAAGAQPSPAGLEGSAAPLSPPQLRVVPGKAVGKATAGGGKEGEALLRPFLRAAWREGKTWRARARGGRRLGESPSRSRSPPPARRDSPGCPPPPCLRRGSRRARPPMAWSRWPASRSTCSRSGTSCSTATERTIAPAPAPSPSSACRRATASEVGTEAGPAAPAPPGAAPQRRGSGAIFSAGGAPGGCGGVWGQPCSPLALVQAATARGHPPAMFLVSRGGVAVPLGVVVKRGRWGGNLPAVRAEEGELVK